MSDDAQPQGGQGEGGGDALYAEHLSAVPEEHRAIVEPVLKDFAGKTISKKLEEHAGYRKQWEPYESLGVNQVDPGELQQLLAFRDVLSDENAFRDWYYQAGNELGLLASDDDDEVGVEEGDGSLTPDQVEQMLAERLAPFEQQFAEREQQERLSAASSYIESEFERLAGEHGELNQDAQEWIASRALAYDGEQAIAQAFEDYQKLVSGVEQGLLKRKTEQPKGPEQGGQAPTGEEENTDWKLARQRAEARVRQDL